MWTHLLQTVFTVECYVLRINTYKTLTVSLNLSEEQMGYFLCRLYKVAEVSGYLDLMTEV